MSKCGLFLAKLGVAYGGARGFNQFTKFNNNIISQWRYCIVSNIIMGVFKYIARRSYSEAFEKAINYAYHTTWNPIIIIMIIVHLTAIFVDSFTASFLELQDLLYSSLVLGSVVVRSSPCPPEPKTLFSIVVGLYSLLKLIYYILRSFCTLTLAAFWCWPEFNLSHTDHSGSTSIFIDITIN